MNLSNIDFSHNVHSFIPVFDRDIIKLITKYGDLKLIPALEFKDHKNP